MCTVIDLANSLGERKALRVLRLPQSNGRAVFVFYRGHYSVTRTYKQEKVVSIMRALVRSV